MHCDVSMQSRFGHSLTASNGAISSPRSLAFLGMEWRTAKSTQVLKAILSCGWNVKRQRGSHKILSRAGWPNFTFAFHDHEEIGPRMLARIAKRTGIRPDQF